MADSEFMELCHLLSPPPLSLYIHIPWCVQKCPYCDFNSHALKSEIPEQIYIDALLDDLDQDLQDYNLLSSSRKLHSVFIGGGTPSLFSAEAIQQLLNGVQARLPFEEGIEITMEANPGTIESERFQAYVTAGVNRISIGVQSFEAEKLEKLGRIHGRQEAIHAAELAHKIGLNSFNLDLMHGLPGQTVAEAMADLDQAIALAPPHLSWYQLTIEPNTLFYSRPPRLPDDDRLWEIYEQGHQKLISAGYKQYETSGYSKPGYQCKHNLNYWRYGDYLGIGCGAHGKLSFDDGRIIRTTKVKHPKGYLNLLKRFRDSEVPVPEVDRPFEFFMNRFRLTEACPKAEFVARTGLTEDRILPLIEPNISQGYLRETATHWQVTEKGKLFLNDLLENLMPDE
ncbi:Oxygen-independent coproporphyrinogen-III oxidase 1 [Vibrio aerogenes CECT 7868]|uniref:Heme chaperone HemW n=1 Tax=Vibrio aerogenes CECT 7868 TaxID=1216006 RepID=A0A1M5YLA6_9VIBR|nr:radical SAM family heme chaperone HemW [Vibrio aerogenes]SHI12721.1 Oxygen-independent coproporphyrinogen-III oxidase 1 [Vibrio aerogenes CECT 7868]